MRSSDKDSLAAKYVSSLSWKESVDRAVVLEVASWSQCWRCCSSLREDEGGAGMSVFLIEVAKGSVR